MTNETYHPRMRLVHGYRVRQHPIYSVWYSLKSRCRNRNESGFNNYGGRGITYDPKWSDFENFANDMYPSYKEGYTIDRIDVNKGYFKENCRWADEYTQAQNRRTFSTNTTGVNGVSYKKGRYVARCQRNGVRYNLGSHATAEKCREYIYRFIGFMDAENYTAALAMTERRINSNSSTGITGVSVHKQGFIVRKTINRERIYLGFSTTLEGAIRILDRD